MACWTQTELLLWERLLSIPVMRRCASVCALRLPAPLLQLFRISLFEDKEEDKESSSLVIHERLSEAKAQRSVCAWLCLCWN